MKDLRKKISMICPTCGNDQFSGIDCDINEIWDESNEIKVKCSDCGMVLSKEELVNENQYIIDENLEDLKKEAIKELEKKIKKMFK